MNSKGWLCLDVLMWLSFLPKPWFDFCILLKLSSVALQVLLALNTKQQTATSVKSTNHEPFAMMNDRATQQHANASSMRSMFLFSFLSFAKLFNVLDASVSVYWDCDLVIQIDSDIFSGLHAASLLAASSSNNGDSGFMLKEKSSNQPESQEEGRFHFAASVASGLDGSQVWLKILFLPYRKGRL